MRRRYSYAEIPAPDSINDDDQCKKSFTVKELADEFGLSVRTLSRDLDELSGLGVPIYPCKAEGRIQIALQERMPPPISFTESEATAIFCVPILKLFQHAPVR